MTYMMSRLDARIAVSEPARSLVSQYFQGPYEIVPNGIGVDRFRGGEPFPWAGDGRPRILFVGRFNEPRKGLKYLLRAMPFVHQQFPDARLVVAGGGNADKLESLMERYGVRNVDSSDWSRRRLPRYYASCDVFCAPSVSGESFGIVLLEAMASGRPVIAGDITGYRSVMTHGREGLLANPRDPHALALAIVRLLADAPLRSQLASNGQQTASQYDWPKIASRVLSVYERALRTSNAQRLSGVS